MADDPPGDSPARTGINGKDAVCSRLDDDLTPDPPSAFAGVVIMAQGQGRPCDLGELLSIMGTAALVHGAHPQYPGGQ